MLLSDQEISQHIISGRHDEGVQWIVQLVQQNHAYLPILLRLLRNAESPGVRQRIAVGLGRMRDIAKGNVFNEISGALILSFAEDIHTCKYAVESLLELTPLSAEAIIGQLEADDRVNFVGQISEALASAGERRALPALVDAVRRFPGSHVCRRSLIRLAGEHAPHYVLAAFRSIPSSSREEFIRELFWVSGYGDHQCARVLQYVWWHLSRGEKQVCEASFRHWFHDLPFHPWSAIFYDRFRDLIKRAHSDEEALARLRQAIGFSSLHAFVNLTSLEDLTALHVDESVGYEEVNVLRFNALVELAKTRDGASIEGVINESSQREGAAGHLLERELECDRLREEVALLRGRLRELLREEAGLLGEAEREEGGRRLEEVQAEIREIGQRIETLNTRLHSQGEGSLAILQHETQRLLPVLRERGVTFRQLVVEGVLGEYDFVEHKVIRYPPMIELAAQDLLSGNPYFASLEELQGALSTVVDIHETAHANLHLGKDSDGKPWLNLTQGSVALHEGLAQFYTLALIKSVNEKKLLEVFQSLSSQQSEEYTLWSVLEPCSLENVRRFVLAQRSRQRLPTIFEVAKEAIHAIAANREWLRSRMGDGVWPALIAQLQHMESKLEKARSPLQLANACSQFLMECAGFSVLIRLLNGILTGGFPSDEDRCLLAMAAICQEVPAPNAYSRTTLRAISIKAAMRERSLPPQERGIGQEIIKDIRIMQMSVQEPLPEQPIPKVAKNKQKGAQPDTRRRGNLKL